MKRKKFLSFISCTSIKYKFTILMLMTFLAVLMICTIIFLAFLSHYASENRKTILNETYLQKETELENYLSNIDNVAQNIIYSKWTQNQLLLDKNLTTEYRKQNSSSDVSSFLNSISSMNNEIYFVIFDLKGQVVQNNFLKKIDSGYDMHAQEWYQQLQKQPHYVEAGENLLFQSSSREWALTYYYPIKHMYNFEYIGYLAIFIPKDSLNFLVQNTPEDIAIAVSADGEIVAGSPGLSMDVLHDTEWAERNYRQRSVSEFTCDFWIQYENEGVAHQVVQQGIILFAIMIPLGILVIIIALLFSRYLTKPIIECKDAFLLIRDNNLGIHLENTYRDEIGELIDGFNDMSDALVTLITQNTAMDVLKQKAEFEMLQQKINPHFLYNTLEIINGLIGDHKNRQAQEVSDSLGKMFRYSLTDKKWVTLKDEYNYVQKYLAITQYKISDLDVDWEVQESVLSVPILKFILQPLVENSIKHGFRDKRQECCLSIRLLEAGNDIRIIVMDNGCGIEAEQLTALHQKFEAIRRDKQHLANDHIGVENIYWRLYLTFGKKMKFYIDSKVGFGTKIELVIPKEAEHVSDMYS